MDKHIVRVLEVIQDGPAHCHDISDELGLPMKTASAILSTLHADGFIKRVGRVTPANAKNPCWIYEACA